MPAASRSGWGSPRPASGPKPITGCSSRARRWFSWRSCSTHCSARTRPPPPESGPAETHCEPVRMSRDRRIVRPGAVRIGRIGEQGGFAGGHETGGTDLVADRLRIDAVQGGGRAGAGGGSRMILDIIDAAGAQHAEDGAIDAGDVRGRAIVQVVIIFGGP